MITLFKNITAELTDLEKHNLVPMLLEALHHSGTGHRITSARLCIYFKNKGHNVSGPRLRKMVSYIRVTNAASPYVVVGASNGYFLTSNQQEIEDQIKSMQGRIDAMRASIDTMQAQKQSLKAM